MRRISSFTMMLLMALALSGCPAVGDFELQIAFPDAESREFCDQVSLYVFAAPSGVEDPCQSFADFLGDENSVNLDLVGRANLPIPLESNSHPLMSDVPVGRMAFVALGENGREQAFLRACEVITLDAEQSAIVELDLAWFCGSQPFELCFHDPTIYPNGWDDDCDGLSDEAPCRQCQVATDCAQAVTWGLLTEELESCKHWTCPAGGGDCGQDTDPDLEGQACNDGDACTLNDSCESGNCVGLDLGCQTGCLTDTDCLDWGAVNYPCVLSWQCIAHREIMRCEPTAVQANGSACDIFRDACHETEGLCQNGECLQAPIDCGIEGLTCILAGCDYETGCTYSANPASDEDQDGAQAASCQSDCGLPEQPCSSCIDCDFSDCDDNDPLVNAGSPERCGNNLDEDCDESADECCRDYAGHSQPATCDNEILVFENYSNDTTLSFSVGDLNGDGLDDLLLSDAAGFEETGHIAVVDNLSTGNGCASFGSERDLVIADRPMHASLIDVDRDGVWELAYLDRDNNDLRLKIRRLDGSLMGDQYVANSASILNLRLDLIEMDGDPGQELSVLYFDFTNSSTHWRVFEPLADGSIPSPSEYFNIVGADLSLVDASFGDFDGDGLDDMALVLHRFMPTEVTYLKVFRCDLNGGVEPIYSKTSGGFPVVGHRLEAIAALDYDEDGRDDLAMLWIEEDPNETQVGSALRILQARPFQDPSDSELFNPSYQLQWPSFPVTKDGLEIRVQLAAADLDGDGLRDLVMLDKPGAKMRLYRNRGRVDSDHFAPAQEHSIPLFGDEGVHSMLPGHFTHQAREDLLIIKSIADTPYNQPPATGSLFIAQGFAEPRTDYLVELPWLGPQLDMSLRPSLKLADLDKSGVQDLIVFSLEELSTDPAAQVWVAEHGTDPDRIWSGAFSATPSLPSFAMPIFSHVADLDGDLLIDLLYLPEHDSPKYFLNSDNPLAPLSPAESMPPIGDIISVLKTFVGNLAGDRPPDLLAVTETSLELRLGFSAMPGSFFLSPPYSKHLGFGSEAVCVFTDSRFAWPQIAIFNPESKTLEIHPLDLLNFSDTTPTASLNLNIDTETQTAKHIAVLDRNGDQLPDIMLSVESNDDHESIVYTWLGQGGTWATEAEQVVSLAQGGGPLLDMTSHDYPWTRNDDLVVVTKERITLLRADTIVFDTNSLYGNLDLLTAEVGDLDHDGRWDVVGITSSGQIRIFMGQQSGDCP